MFSILQLNHIIAFNYVVANNQSDQLKKKLVELETVRRLKFTTILVKVTTL